MQKQNPFIILGCVLGAIFICSLVCLLVGITGTGILAIMSTEDDFGHQIQTDTAGTPNIIIVTQENFQ